MRIAILGAGGMLGIKLARALDQGALGSCELLLVDIIKPQGPERADKRALDLSLPSSMNAIASFEPDLVFHLAAVVSGQAEVEFDTGYSINFDLTRSLAEALRGLGTSPRLIFSSSLAVYGPPFANPIPENFRPTPSSSYGAQKALAELLLADYTRKGFLRATSVRLPTVTIRPGKPNAAASGFLSSILREPLHGKPAGLPVSEDTRVWIASPDISVAGLIHAASLPWEDVSDLNPINLRGISVQVSQMLDALEQIAGIGARQLVKTVPDEAVARIVTSWPSDFITDRAKSLGFPVNSDMTEIVSEYCKEFAPDLLAKSAL